MTQMNCGKCGECELEVLETYGDNVLCYNCKYRRKMNYES